MFNHQASRLYPRRVRVEQLEDRRLLAVTGVEQELIYLLNRARHDPGTYQIEQSLPVNLAGVESRAPLAVSDELSNSADVKATDMTTGNYFAHASPTGVQANQLARDANYPLPDFYPSDANFIESLSAGSDQDQAALPLNGLIIDAGLSDPLHRNQLLAITEFYESDREIGVGYSASLSATFNNYWVMHLARRSDPLNFLTGVVFSDANDNQRYEAGEGLPGVTITVDGIESTTTNAAGGWSIPANDGVHTIVASGRSFSGVSTATAIVDGNNVEVDFLSGNAASQVAFAETYGRNPMDAFDVNSENGVTAGDALLVINHLGRVSSGGQSMYGRATYLDVNGDRGVSSLDALLVINEVARRGTAAERERVPLSVLLSDSEDHAVRDLALQQVAMTFESNLPKLSVLAASESSNADHMIKANVIGLEAESGSEQRSSEHKDLAFRVENLH